MTGARPAALRIVGGAMAALIVLTGSSVAHAGAPTAASRVSSSRVLPVDPAAESARLRIAEMTSREQAASIVMGHIPTTDPVALAAYMSSTGIGGFILMGSNIPENEEALRAVTASLVVDPTLPPLIAIDQEGGLVSRLPWDAFAASSTLKSAPIAQTSTAFSARAALVARSGANVNFGIVADTTADPSSFIFGRSLGTDPAASAERVAAAVVAEETLVASTLKHFPGHGAAPGDSHTLIPTTGESYEEWSASDAAPFAAGIDAGASLLMFGHLAYTSVDALPASLSPRWHEIARDDLGFDGVIVTDDLGMLQSTGIPEYADPVANAVSAVAAGNDLILTIAHSTPQTADQIVQGIVDAVDDGSLPADRLADAATQVMALRLELSASAAVWRPQL